MNLILLQDEDFLSSNTVRLQGRRLRHVLEVHRATVGATLSVGRLGGLMGRGLITHLDSDCLEMEVDLAEAPPPKQPLNLLLALPRPKVLNRVLASAASLGLQHIVLLNAWKVEKAYWKSPRMAEENLQHQLRLGLEQARDTVLPTLTVARLFRPFLEDQLPDLVRGTRALLAHPGSATPCPAGLNEPVTLAIGPEGGWIDAELMSFQGAGFQSVGLGPRILRVETAVATLVGRLIR